MQIIENKALLVSVDDPSAITNAITKSARTASGVVVHWGYKEAEKLTTLGFNPPSPILRDYQWTGKFTPFEHQKTTASFLSLRKRAFCFNEQGTGKTASVIWAADYLMNKGLIKRVLVLCPLSIMKSAWQQDLFKFAMHRSCSVAHGAAKQRGKIIQAGSEFVVINFDGVATVLDEIMAGGFDLIVVDEASAYKTATTNRWKLLHKILKHTDPRLWMLTGTPAAQSPLDAYGLGKLVNPEGTPKYYTHFRFNTMYPVTKFKWAPKPEAPKIVHNILQPAIRFEKKDCLDLPEVTYVDRDAPLTPQQAKYYKQLHNDMVLEAAGEEVSAVNAAVRMNKLLQISCLAEGTSVLTTRGWINIEKVTSSDKVWDGEEWVACGGAAYMGLKPTVYLDGVHLTGDHRVLTASGWAPAEECLRDQPSVRFGRVPVRLPDGFAPCGDFSQGQQSPLGVRLHLRAGGGAGVPEPTIQTSPQPKALRLPARRAYKDTRHDPQSPVPYMVAYAKAVLRPFAQGLSKLWSAGHNGMSGVDGLVLGFLGGHGGRVRPCADFGSHGQQRTILPRELPLGDREDPIKQHTEQRCFGDAERAHDAYAGSGDVWDTERNPSRSGIALRMGDRRSTYHSGRAQKVYDLISCGPRSRFVVRGSAGQTFIVHNCGAVYTDDGQVLEFDVSNRLNAVQEVIEEASHKVLVFVPFTHTIELLRDHLEKKGISCGVINGSVSVNRRAALIDQFQTAKDPHTLIIQPQAASHGLTLTAADTIIWYAPVTSVETYLQANARINRPGQKNAMTVVHIRGSEAESHLYNMLRGNITNHERVIDLYRKIFQ